MNYEAVKKARDIVPAKHVVLTPDAFADDWSEKPILDVAVGIRRIADADLQTARAEAAKFALSMHDDRDGQIESFNDALMRWVIVRATCDVNDIRLNTSLFDGSEENVRAALTAEGIRYLWEEIERYFLESSPTVPYAKEEEVRELGQRLLTPESFIIMSNAKRVRILKLAAFILNELRTSDPTWVPPEERDTDLDELDEPDAATAE